MNVPVMDNVPIKGPTLTKEEEAYTKHSQANKVIYFKKSIVTLVVCKCDI